MVSNVANIDDIDFDRQPARPIGSSREAASSHKWERCVRATPTPF
jgi:hypothetical protein